jgi:putative ABC transport system substrate-binding protein
MRRRELIALLSGAAVSWPLGVHAQQKPMPVIGYVGITPSARSARVVAAFRQGLGETGYVEGQNVAIEYRWSEGLYDRLPALFADLVAHKVDVIIAGGGAAGGTAAKSATSIVPIVFAVGTDPVADGLVASLARPGGNLTGVSIQLVELVPKRFELLSELIPQASVIALLANPQNPGSERQTREVQKAAHERGLQLHILSASTEAEIDVAFTSLVRLHPAALIVGADAYFNTLREQIVVLVSRHAIPAIYEWREFVEAGGLISYGPSISGVNRQVGIYAGLILKGANPADLPIQQPTRFELVINLKTAKTLGLTVPQSLLARADEVIE